MTSAAAVDLDLASVAESDWMRGEPAIRADHLSRSYESDAGVVTAVNDVSLSVEKGEFLVIVGPSGCGKTTLLRMIAGLENPSSGTIAFGRHGQHEMSNAMVFQGHSVFPWLRVHENVEYGIRLDGQSKKERQEATSRLLNTVGLSRFADAYPHQLSEGMRQRVAIARAMAVDPDLLLMDEPFGALDEQTRFILQEEILRIWEDTGKTVVLVTHSIDEALTLADRIVVMTAHPGEIKASILVPFDRPRDQSTVRSNPAFAELFTEIWELIREEVRKSRVELQELLD